MQSPQVARSGKVDETVGKAQALVSFGTRGIFGRFAKSIDQVVQ
jgi:hypothetical protein